MSDMVGRAIAVASAQPQQWKGRIALRASGREVGLVVPADLSAVELVDLIAFLADQLPSTLAKARAEHPASRILVPV